VILFLDNFDSFTFNLVDYFYQLGIECEVVRNNIPPESLDWSKYNALVISPGPGTPKQAGYLFSYLAYALGKIPVLGICLGHQAIGEFFGAELKTGNAPVHGKVSLISHNNHPLFEGISQEFEACRYHSLELINLPSCLQSIATTHDGVIMIIRHTHFSVFGIQFHPEAILTPCGLQLLQNWVKQELGK
jgi:anthranilate synthase/aminodeoxychorismate synthase-like glutamine amidotransferase